MKKKKTITKIFIFLFVVLVTAVILLGIDFYHKVYTPYKEYPDVLVIQVKKGASVSEVGRLLYRENIIASYTYFRIYYRFFFKGASIKSGEYRFDRPQNHETGN